MSVEAIEMSKNSDCADSGVSGRPLIDEPVARAAVTQLYAVEVTFVRSFVSYDDRNFEVHARTDNSREAKTFLLKVSGCTESKCDDQLRKQNRVMQYLSSKGLTCQVPHVSVNGKLVEHIQLPTKANEASLRWHAVRLFSFVDGEPMRQHAPFTSTFCHRLGQYLAGMHVKLAELQTSWVETIPEPEWSLTNCIQCFDYLEDVENSERRDLVKCVLTTFKETVLSRLSSTKFVGMDMQQDFPRTLIHGDPNQLNILVQQKSVGDQEYQFGIIDWEDCALSFRIYDLAILLMSMLCCLDLDRDDVLELGSQVVTGYQTYAAAFEIGLTSSEMAVLPLLVATRFAQSLVIGQHSYNLDPSNTYPLLTSREGGWKKLADLFVTRPSQYQLAWSKCLQQSPTVEHS